MDVAKFRTEVVDLIKKLFIFFVCFFVSIAPGTSFSEDEVPCPDPSSHLQVISTTNDLTVNSLLDLTSKSNIKLDGVKFPQDISGPYHLETQIECLERFKSPNLKEILEDSLNIGMACLKSLPGKKAKDHLNKMSKLFNDPINPAKFICTEKKPRMWEKLQAQAHASPEADYTLDLPGGRTVKHPYVSIIPSKKWENNLHELKRTFFHELFHNIGYVHHEDIEYAYACPACCFSNDPNVFMSPSPTQVKSVESACHICSKDYDNGQFDKEYLVDILNWRKNDRLYGRTVEILLKYFEKNPGEEWAVNQLSDLFKLDTPLFKQTLLNPDFKLPDNPSKIDQYAYDLANVFRLLINGDKKSASYSLSLLDIENINSFGLSKIEENDKKTFSMIEEALKEKYHFLMLIHGVKKKKKFIIIF
jgi:hypothetical protein